MKPPLEVSPIEGGQRVKVGQDVQLLTHKAFAEFHHQYYLPEPDLNEIHNTKATKSNNAVILEVLGAVLESCEVLGCKEDPKSLYWPLWTFCYRLKMENKDGKT